MIILKPFLQDINCINILIEHIKDFIGYLFSKQVFNYILNSILVKTTVITWNKDVK
jgi:hypothetical protein